MCLKTLAQYHTQQKKLISHLLMLRLWCSDSTLQMPPCCMSNSCITKFGVQPVRMAVIKKNTKNTCWQRRGEKGTLVYCWWKCKLVQPLGRIHMTQQLLGMYLKKNKTHQFKKIHAPQWKQPKCTSTDEWVKRICACVHTHTHTMEWYMAIKKECNNVI